MEVGQHLQQPVTEQLSEEKGGERSVCSGAEENDATEDNWKRCSEGIACDISNEPKMEDENVGDAEVSCEADGAEVELTAELTAVLEQVKKDQRDREEQLLKEQREREVCTVGNKYYVCTRVFRVCGCYNIMQVQCRSTLSNDFVLYLCRLNSLRK